MASTARVGIQNTWRDVASAGNVCITPTTGCYWSVTDTGLPPTHPEGHMLRGMSSITMTLEGTEKLWVKQKSGVVYVTRDVP